MVSLAHRLVRPTPPTAAEARSAGRGLARAGRGLRTPGRISPMPSRGTLRPPKSLPTTAGAPMPLPCWANCSSGRRVGRRSVHRVGVGLLRRWRSRSDAYVPELSKCCEWQLRTWSEPRMWTGWALHDLRKAMTYHRCPRVKSPTSSIGWRASGASCTVGSTHQHDKLHQHNRPSR